MFVSKTTIIALSGTGCMILEHGSAAGY
jgi:hypothetical protein